MLNNEKEKYDGFRSGNNKEVENERMTKSKYEELILKQKEDLIRKDIEINRINIDFELKISEEIQEKINLSNENKILTEKLDRLKSTYEEKYRILAGILITIKYK